MLATLSFLLISNTSTLAPNPIGNTQLAFIDALVNSMTKGEGALKHTCYQVRHTSEATTFIEQEQCRQAQKEVDFSKRQYPIALAFVSRYERQELNSTTDQLRYLSDSSKFIKDCKTEENIRAAKTMRYWGTEEVGDWHYTNLKEMGADNYKSILSKGDLNKDQIFNIKDILIIIDLILHEENNNDLLLWVSDINNDQEISVLDVILLTSLILEANNE